jgi:hypothetical protein
MVECKQNVRDQLLAVLIVLGNNIHVVNTNTLQ